MSARGTFRELMEPGACAIDGETRLPFNEIALVSIAISAKRIADAMIAARETVTPPAVHRGADFGAVTIPRSEIEAAPGAVDFWKENRITNIVNGKCTSCGQSKADCDCLPF